MRNTPATRKNIIQLMDLRTQFDRVPFPRYDSIEGAVVYANDMRKIKPLVSDILYGIVVEGQEDTEEGYDYQNPDEMLVMLRGFIDGRIREGWA